MIASGLYAGVVTHARRGPRPHRLAYRVFMLLLDLDELEALDRRLRLLSIGRPALASFHPRDHLGGASDLKAQAQQVLRAHGLPIGGPIRVLCMPRILGRAFNPLSVYFCHGADGALGAVLYEVNNTFGGRHVYALPVTEREGLVRQGCEKTFYVSPFMDMGLSYQFRVAPPGDSVGVQVKAMGPEGLVLAAAFHGRRRELSDANLLAAWLGHPLMSLGVAWAIRWEALKIWVKGERLRPRPKPSVEAGDAAARRATDWTVESGF